MSLRTLVLNASPSPSDRNQSAAPHLHYLLVFLLVSTSLMESTSMVTRVSLFRFFSSSPEEPLPEDLPEDPLELLEVDSFFLFFSLLLTFFLFFFCPLPFLCLFLLGLLLSFLLLLLFQPFGTGLLV